MTGDSAETNLRRAVGELGDLVRALSANGNFERFQQDFERWRFRTATILDRVSAREAKKFRYLQSRPSWVSMEDGPDSVITEHASFLSSLIDDLGRHPEAYNRDDAPTGPAVLPAPPRVELALPDKVTLRWLFTHVPIGAWIAIAGVVVAAFAIGYRLGRIPEAVAILGPLLGK